VLTYYHIKLLKGGLIIMKKKIATLLVASMTMCTVLAGCGQSSKETTTSSSSTLSDDAVYAVEAGSAGEAVAEEKGFKYNSVASQADALMEVASGTSDAAIIDLLMAGAMIGEGTSYPNMKYTDELTTEEYGVGCRLGSDLASYINQVFYDSYTDGTMQETAKTYGVQESLVEQPESEYTASDDSDVEYIKSKGTLIVGITDFEPMDYKDSSDNWIGFDADMAKIVAESLGVEIKFVEIDWDNKIMELNSKNIDVVWNGMTLTSEVTSSMECTNAYCNNAQVIVVNK
jgi:polar amino acid transport system substrate-binding protein